MAVYDDIERTFNFHAVARTGPGGIPAAGELPEGVIRGACGETEGRWCCYGLAVRRVP